MRPRSQRRRAFFGRMTCMSEVCSFRYRIPQYRTPGCHLPNYIHCTATSHHRRTTHLIKTLPVHLPHNSIDFVDMRFTTLSVLTALFAATTMAAAPQRSVIISFPNDTPDHIVEEAKEGIRKAKGVITHEYSECLRRDAFGRRWARCRMGPID